MRISLVICHVPINKQLDGMLDECLTALSGYDELILVVNNGDGYGKSYNRGFKYAKGNFIIAVSNDAVLYEGSLDMLCDSKAVTYSENAQWGCFFCLPRWVYEKIGGFDERFTGAYYEDHEYQDRLKGAGIPLKRVMGVKVHHVGGVTVKALGKEQEWSEKNRKVYEDIVVKL